MLDCQSKANSALAYFYIDFNDIKKRTAEAVTRSLIAQLSSQSEKYYEDIEILYTEHQHGKRQPTLTSLFTTLHRLILQFNTVYIVIDALDEAEDVEEVFQLLQKAKEWTLPSLHILVSSRQLYDIQKALEYIATDQIFIHERFIQDDIKLYLRTSLLQDRKLSRWPEEVLKEVEETLLLQARGM